MIDKHDHPLLVGLPDAPKTLTEAQLKRIVRDEKRIAARREIRCVPIYNVALTAMPGQNCARCSFLGDFDAERQVGFCMYLRRMMSTWHPIDCEAMDPT